MLCDYMKVMNKPTKLSMILSNGMTSYFQINSFKY